MDLKKYASEILGWVKSGQWARHGDDVILRQDILISGKYYLDDGESGPVCNLLPAAGILDILNVYFGSTAKRPAFYLGLYAAAVTPTSALTAANFAATLSEITSNTDGYSELTRPQWTPGAAAGGKIGNLAARASFSIATPDDVTINGAALISDNVKGGTAGVLPSAARFTTPRVRYNGETFDLGYEVELTSV